MQFFLFFFCVIGAAGALPPLRLKNDETFHIMQVADTQYWDQGARDLKTSALLRKLIQYEQPDFIAHTGDVVYSSHISGGLARYKTAWNTMVAQFNNTPYAVSLGNHDQNTNIITLDQILQNDQTHPNCYSSQAPGLAPYNYYLDVLRADDSIAWRLWFINTGPDLGTCEGFSSAGCAPADVVSWMYTQGCELNIPSIIFAHIPVYQLKNLTDVTGTRQDKMPTQATDTGLASFALRCNARVMMFGHMHGNDFSGWYTRDLPGKGLAFALFGYGRNTGYGYRGAADLQRGARMFSIRNDGTFETWIRQEDGTRIDYTTFNDKFARRVQSWFLNVSLVAIGTCIVTFLLSILILYERDKTRKEYTNLPVTKKI